MASIPYKPFPDVTPTDRPTPYLSTRAMPEAFGVNIGEALSRSGDELFGRAMALQQLRNQSDADELYSEYIIESSKLRAKYQTLEGKDAPDQFEKHAKDLDDLRQQIGGKASNNFTRKLYDSHTRGFMSREVYSAAQHAATENKRYNHKVIDDKEISVHDEVSHRPASERTIAASQSTLRDVYRQRAAMKGWDIDTEQIEYQRGLSKLLYTQITSLSKSNPEAADRLLKENEINLYGDDLPRAQGIVDSAMRVKGSTAIAEGIVKPPEGEKFEKSLQDYIKEATDKATEVRPDDPLMRSATQDAVIARYHKLYGAKREADAANKNVMDRAVTGGYGRLPASVAEMLKLHPEVEATWQKMTDTQRKPYFSAIANLQKMPDLSRRNYEFSQEGVERYQELIGMKNNNPQEFLNLHLPSEQFRIPTIQALIRMQGDLGKKAEEDPRVSHALNIIRNARGPVMDELNIYRRTESTKEDYDRFVGALQMGLDRLREEKKAPPKQEEIIALADSLMFRKATPRFGGIFGGIFGTSKEEPIYNVTVPDKIRTEFIEQYKKTFKQDPTDEEIRREYVRSQLRNLGKSQLSKPTVPKKTEQDNPAKPEERKPPLKQRPQPDLEGI